MVTNTKSVQFGSDLKVIDGIGFNEFTGYKDHYIYLIYSPLIPANNCFKCYYKSDGSLFTFIVNCGYLLIGIWFGNIN